MSRSRWGGFLKGRSRYKNWWDDLKSSRAISESVEAPADITEFNYKDAQGIWNLNSTVNLRGSASGGGGAVFEGYATNSSSNGSGHTVDFSSLTGTGSAAAGDLAILIMGTAGRYLNDQAIQTSGWTEFSFGRLSANDTYDASARVYYKTLGAGETSVQINSATGSVTSYVSSASGVLIFSGSSGTPTSFHTGNRTNSSQPIFQEYTGLTSGNFIIDWAVAATTAGAEASYTSNDYDTLGYIAESDTSDAAVGFGIKQVTSPTFQGSMTHSSNSTSFSNVYGQLIIS